MRVTHLDLGRSMRGGQYQVASLIEELGTLGVEQRLLGPHGDRFSIGGIRRDCDIVHAHDARSHTYAALFARVPVVVSRRVAFPVGRSIASRWKYKQPALYLAVSKFVAGRLIEAGVPAAKIEVVYDGVPRLEASTLDGPIIAPRTEDPMKGSDLIRSSGVEVEFVDDLRSALRTARGLLYITREEGLGSAALLAMSAGVPVIASRVGGLPEIVRHGETGWLVENEAAAIAAAVGLLRSEWGARGREMVHSGFLAAHTAEQTLAAYQRVLA